MLILQGTTVWVILDSNLSLTQLTLPLQTPFRNHNYGRFLVLLMLVNFPCERSSCTSLLSFNTFTADQFYNARNHSNVIICNLFTMRQVGKYFTNSSQPLDVVSPIKTTAFVPRIFQFAKPSTKRRNAVHPGYSVCPFPTEKYSLRWSRMNWLPRLSSIIIQTRSNPSIESRVFAPDPRRACANRRRGKYLHRITRAPHYRDGLVRRVRPGLAPGARTAAIENAAKLDRGTRKGSKWWKREVGKKWRIRGV